MKVLQLSQAYFKRLQAGGTRLHFGYDMAMFFVPTSLLSQFGVPKENIGNMFFEVADYIESVARAGSRDVCRAKIIFLGKGGAGKSSLMARLVHNTFEDGRAVTEGIDVGMQFHLCTLAFC